MGRESYQLLVITQVSESLSVSRHNLEFARDSFIMLRHPNLETTLQMADAVGNELQMYAE